jgi:hypothetical protein
VDLGPLDAADARRLIDEALAQADAGGALGRPDTDATDATADVWLPADATAGVLKAYGLAPGTRQPQGTEVVAGVVHDPVFGPLVTLAPVGSQSSLVPSLVRHQRARALPLTDVDAADLVDEVLVGGSDAASAAPGAPLGAPGGKGARRAGLVDLVARLGRLAEELPEVADLVIDPELDAGARIRVVPPEARPELTLRRLR